jgi:hypothetical protein
MSDENTYAIDGQAEILSRKSWLAYLGAILAVGILLIISIPAIAVFSWPVAIGTGAIMVAYLAYQLLLIRSVKLYVDQDGVWVYSGVLPWRRGVAGVKWRDIDEAVYSQGLVAWMTRAYKLRIGHRFTKSSELVLTVMSHGDQAAMEINARHQTMIRAGGAE